MSRPRRPLPISTLLARLGTVAGIALAVYSVVTLIGFLSQRSYLPAGSSLAGLDVSGLTAQEATLAIDQALAAPLTIRLPDNTPLILAPASLDFAVDDDATRSAIERALGAHYALSNFPARLLRQSGAPPRLDPVTRHDAGKVDSLLETLAQNNDRPAAPGCDQPGDTAAGARRARNRAGQSQCPRERDPGVADCRAIGQPGR